MTTVVNVYIVIVLGLLLVASLDDCVRIDVRHHRPAQEIATVTSDSSWHPLSSSWLGTTRDVSAMPHNHRSVLSCIDDKHGPTLRAANTTLKPTRLPPTSSYILDKQQPVPSRPASTQRNAPALNHVPGAENGRG